MNRAARVFLCAGMLLVVACGGEQGAESGEQVAPPSDPTQEQGAESGERTAPPSDPTQEQGAESGERTAPSTTGGQRPVETLSGRILETGPEPGAVTLQLDDSTSINLVGDLQSELHNLSGATVSVEGRRGTEHPTLGTFDVYRYWITSIDGVRPEVGIFESYETSWFLLVGDTPVALADVPDDLKTRDGALIWIIGERTPTRLRVQSYGVIKPK
jgi:hypothetical protein